MKTFLALATTLFLGGCVSTGGLAIVSDRPYYTSGFYCDPVVDPFCDRRHYTPYFASPYYYPNWYWRPYLHHHYGRW